MPHLFDKLDGAMNSKSSADFEELVKTVEIIYRKILLKANKEGIYTELDASVIYPLKEYIYQTLFQEYVKQNNLSNTTDIRKKWSDYLVESAQALPRKDQENLGFLDTSLSFEEGQVPALHFPAKQKQDIAMWKKIADEIILEMDYELEVNQRIKACKEIKVEMAKEINNFLNQQNGSESYASSSKMLEKIIQDGKDPTSYVAKLAEKNPQFAYMLFIYDLANEAERILGNPIPLEIKDGAEIEKIQKSKLKDIDELIIKNKDALQKHSMDSKYQGKFKKVISFLSQLGSVGEKIAQTLMKGYDYMHNKNRKFSMHVVDRISDNISQANSMRPKK